jgi:L-threonylcarbamoyladenylate synthase
MLVLPSTDENIVRAADALRAAKVIAYPTETVYGFGVDPLNPRALDRLLAVKGRDAANPMLLIVSSIEQLRAVAGDLSPRAATYAKAFWPGPLSMLFTPLKPLPQALTGTDGRICIRWTASPIATALCDAFGGAIVSTSANRSGEPPATSAREIPTDGVTLCLDAGQLPRAQPSTVFDPESGEVLREGGITREQLAEFRQ